MIGYAGKHMATMSKLYLGAAFNWMMFEIHNRSREHVAHLNFVLHRDN
jgi:hypothetical protein